MTTITAKTFTATATLWGLVGTQLISTGRMFTSSAPVAIQTGTPAEIQAAYQTATGKPWGGTPVKPTPPTPPPAMCDAAQLKVLHAMLILLGNAGFLTQQAVATAWADAQSAGCTVSLFNIIDGNCTAAGITAAQITDEVASLP